MRSLVFLADSSTSGLYTLSLHDALPISSTPCHPRTRSSGRGSRSGTTATDRACGASTRSEEHTSELQSRRELVCRLLHEKNEHAFNAANIGAAFIDSVEMKAPSSPAAARGAIAAAVDALPGFFS